MEEHRLATPKAAGPNPAPRSNDPEICERPGCNRPVEIRLSTEGRVVLALCERCWQQSLRRLTRTLRKANPRRKKP